MGSSPSKLRMNNAGALRGFVSWTFRSNAIGQDFDVDLALAGAIKFGEEDALPTAERQLPFLDEDELGHTGEHGFDVRVRVALGVAIGASHGDQAVEGAFGVGGHVGIGMFVDEDAGRSVGNVEEASADAEAQSGDNALDILGDIDHLGAARGFYGDGLHGSLLTGSRLQYRGPEGFIAQKPGDGKQYRTPQTPFGMTGCS